MLFVNFGPKCLCKVEETSQYGHALQTVIDAFVDINLKVRDNLLQVELDFGVLEGLQHEGEEDLGAGAGAGICSFSLCFPMLLLNVKKNNHIHALFSYAF